MNGLAENSMSCRDVEPEVMTVSPIPFRNANASAGSNPAGGQLLTTEKFNA
jgi:hypothetical protein